MQQQLEKLIDCLRKEGFRITPQRIAIVEHILKSEDHPSAECIHNHITKKYPMVSLSTVYKTLELLRHCNCINEIEVKGETRFDAKTEDHVNLVCMKCGKIEDIDESLQEIQSRVARKSKYLVLKGSFELRGYCSDCKSKIKN